MTESSDESPCPHCIAAQGLCAAHERGILPLLAVNLGWLRLIGESHVEQRRRQSPATEAAAIEKAKRREARKRARSGMRGLITHILTAA